MINKYRVGSGISRDGSPQVRVKPVSVCLASFNGGEYIKAQVDSILRQLNVPDDELLIIDDVSTDSTIEYLRSINDVRVKVFQNDSNLGYIRNFERAMSLASNDYIFLCDQDDLWVDNRVDIMFFASDDSKRGVVIGNFTYLGCGKAFSNKVVSVGEQQNEKGMSNIIAFMSLTRIPYFGCCMLIRRSALAYILPFSHPQISHDIWIAIAANVRNDLFHIPDLVTYRRLHENNLTKQNRNIFAKIKTRVLWSKAIFNEIFRRKKMIF